MHRGYFAFEKIIKHVWLFRWFVHSARKFYRKFVFNRKNSVKVRFWDKTFCEGSVFEMKYFVKGPFLRRNILWSVHFWDEAFWKGSIFEMKNFVKGPFTDPVLPLDWPLSFSLFYVRNMTKNMDKKGRRMTVWMDSTLSRISWVW